MQVSLVPIYIIPTYISPRNSLFQSASPPDDIVRLLNLEGADSPALAEVITDYWTVLHSFKPYCYQVSQHITSSTNYAISPWSARRMRIQKNFSRCIVHTKISVPTPMCKSSRISATQQPIRNKFGTNVEKGQLV